MQRLLITLVAAAAICAAFETNASAQLIRIRPRPDGGTSIRVPFVRVETDGAGGSHVRAPFTETFTPGFGMRPAYPGRLQPTPSSQPTPAELSLAPGPSKRDLQDVNWQQLRQVLRSSASQLDGELDSDWRMRLQPGAVADLVSEDVNLPPNQEVAGQLRGLLVSYQDISADEATSSFLGPRFQLVKEALSEIVQPPIDRQMRLLRSSFSELDRSLQQFTNGSDWQRYLQLPIGGTRSSNSVLVQDSPASSASRSGEVDRLALETSLSRYDQVRDDPRFEVIARLPAFQSTHAELGVMVGLLPAPGTIEELPRPTRDK